MALYNTRTPTASALLMPRGAQPTQASLVSVVIPHSCSRILVSIGLSGRDSCVLARGAVRRARAAALHRWRVAPVAQRRASVNIDECVPAEMAADMQGVARAAEAAKAERRGKCLRVRDCAHVVGQFSAKLFDIGVSRGIKYRYGHGDWRRH